MNYELTYNERYFGQLADFLKWHTETFGDQQTDRAVRAIEETLDKIQQCPRDTGDYSLVLTISYE